jgi:hypothetical protein
LFEAVNVIVGESARISLRLCQWHAIKAIKRRFISIGQYPKGKGEELMILVQF